MIFFVKDKTLDIKAKISYILCSKPTAPLPKGMRNPVGFCFFRRFCNEI